MAGSMRTFVTDRQTDIKIVDMPLNETELYYSFPYCE